MVSSVNIAYLVINAILSMVMLAYSFSIDSKTKHTSQESNVNSVVNMILFLSAIFGMMAITLAAIYWLPSSFSRIFGCFTFTFIAWFSVSSCVYILTYPKPKKSVAVIVIQWLLNISAPIVLFIIPGVIYDVGVDVNGSFHIYSQHIMDEFFRGTFSMTYFFLYIGFYLILVPLFTILMVLVKAENEEAKLLKQNLRLNVSAVASSWLLFVIMVFASRYQTMMYSLCVMCFIPELMLMIRSFRTDEIWDRRIVVRGILRFLLRYALPSFVAGLLWVVTWPFFTKTPMMFFTVYIIGIMILMVGWQVAASHLSNIDFLRSARYEKEFENSLSTINFEGDTSEITEKVFQTFKHYVDTSKMNILVDGGDGYLSTIYTSDGENLQIPIDEESFEVILAQKHPIIFREAIEGDYSVAIVKKTLIRILDNAHSDGFILLNEGHHIIGIIFLGKKESGNIYNEYDNEVFTKLYSNLFVIGYYLKNIMNESIVGTVNREIRMSGQIITSIQENMDHIKNPKVDVGYRMIPAHTIGGEFVDLIRLTDTRHIIIIGSLNSRGIAASMNMVILKSIIRTFLVDTTDFKVLVEKVNRFIRESLPKGTYFAGTFALMDFKTDTLYYINCGSPALFLYTKAYNNVIEIQGEGRILGFAKDIGPLVKVKKIKLSPGDIVLACTDGLIESQSLRGDMFGKDRVQKNLVDNVVFDADKMSQFEYDALIQFTSKEVENDITVLVLKYLGGK